MPWTKQNRWSAFLILAAVLLLGIAAGVVVSRSRLGGSLNDVERSIVHGCVVIASVIGTALGMGKHLRANIRHDTRGELQPVRLEMNDLPQQVVNTFNGGLDKAVKKQLDASPFPTTPEQLKAFIKDCQATNCEEVALTAARQAVAEMEQRGWKPPGTGMQL